MLSKILFVVALCVTTAYAELHESWETGWRDGDTVAQTNGWGSTFGQIFIDSDSGFQNSAGVRISASEAGGGAFKLLGETWGDGMFIVRALCMVTSKVEHCGLGPWNDSSNYAHLWMKGDSAGLKVMVEEKWRPETVHTGQPFSQLGWFEAQVVYDLNRRRMFARYRDVDDESGSPAGPWVSLGTFGERDSMPSEPIPWDVTGINIYVYNQQKGTTQSGVLDDITAGPGTVIEPGAPWPTYRHDSSRSGVTSEPLSTPLRLNWTFEPRHAPKPAWPDPPAGLVEGALELRRVHFDDAAQVAVADGAVYFGSSSEDKVFCLDLASGAIRWTALTAGPVRLAPTYAGGRLYFGADDGHVYCLNAYTGQSIWNFRAAPENHRLLGNGRMISLWPVRTSVLVDGNDAFFGAGLFPSEGVFLYRLNAGSGRVVWCQDAMGERPHSAVSPQGYLLASQQQVFVPLGRTSPAAFDRRDGSRNYEISLGSWLKHVGGTFAMLGPKNDLYTGTKNLAGYRGSSGAYFTQLNAQRLLATEDTLYLASGDYELWRNKPSHAALTAQDRRTGSERWKIEKFPCHDELILADDLLIAGGPGRVIAVNARTGEQIWEAEVEGIAKGLAASSGQLLVSTDTGKIYCFGPVGSHDHGVVREQVDESPFAKSPHTSMIQAAAESILETTAVTRGYCLVLGIETGQLAVELARRSDLRIIAVDSDRERVAAARRAIDAAGLYGARISIERWPLDAIPYADYFADLIVSESALVTGDLPPASALRMLRPIGGAAVVGQPATGGHASESLDANSLGTWLSQVRRAAATDESLTIDRAEVIESDGAWAILSRGKLPGAGQWTHQYGNAGNTGCSQDERIRGPLSVLWYGEPGPARMLGRHLRAAAPLSFDGRMFVEGDDVLMAYNGYNGVKLWERQIKGASYGSASSAHRGSNIAVGRHGLFVALADGDACLRLDLDTGQTLSSYRLPAAVDEGSRRWGYLAVDGDLLYGGRTEVTLSEKMQSLIRQSPLSARGEKYAPHNDLIFSVSTESGERQWSYEGKAIPPNAIAIGDGRVFLIDSNVSPDERASFVESQQRRIEELPEADRQTAAKLLESADIRKIVALDARTGELLWWQVADLNRSRGQSESLSKDQALLYHDGVVVLFGMYLDGHWWREFFAGGLNSRRMTCLDARNGRRLWSRKVPYFVRPLIIGDTLHAEPFAFDLRSGETRTRSNPITGQADAWQFTRPGHHCGPPVASANAMFFRSYNLGYYDLPSDMGTMHFAGNRPGCWINFIPAGGVLMVPEASAGCQCPFPLSTTAVFKTAQQHKGWAMYSVRGPSTPVSRLGVNLGAPGDRKDNEGTLWVGYPRPGDKPRPEMTIAWPSLLLKLGVETTFMPGGRFVARSSVYTRISGTRRPWLFSCGAQGLRRCVVPLLAEDDPPARYRVRLAFVELENDLPGQRVFDIKLQDHVVEYGFDVLEAAGTLNQAVFREYENIEVRDKLTIELLPDPPNPAWQQMPVLQAIEVIREP